ncbi:MAG: hypothetical protein V1694_07155 [Candidatus Eisenbacteria bacterium]
MKSVRILRSEQGYLIIEVLLASLILSVGIVALLKSFGSSVQAAKISSSYAKAVAIAEETLMSLENEVLVDQSGQPDSTQNQDGFNVSIRSVDRGAGLREVQVSVVWHDGRRESKISVSSLVMARESEGGSGEMQ